MLLGKEEEKIKKNIALNMSFFLITSTQNTPVPPSHNTSTFVWLGQKWRHTSFPFSSISLIRSDNLIINMT